jgi:hypothetical protein
MNTFLAVVAFAAGALLAIAPPAQAQWSESRLQSLYQDYLDTKGVESWVDSDGDVQFEYADRTYFMEVNENDNEFFRVVLFNIWPIESDSEYVEAAVAVNEVNKQMKVAKAYITDDNVWVACELFVGSPENFRPVWQRCMDVIDQGVDTFVEGM